MKIIPPIRGLDSWGSGEFNAPRGSRKHKGIDIACYKGSKIVSDVDGTITKYGYPYNPEDSKKGHLRYVQITDGQGFDYRYFYVSLPEDKKVGDSVSIGDVIGITQGLDEVYPDITDHFHFEVKKNNKYYNPNLFIEE